MFLAAVIGQTHMSKPGDSSGEISLPPDERFFFMSVQKYTLDLFKMFIESATCEQTSEMSCTSCMTTYAYRLLLIGLVFK